MSEAHARLVQLTAGGHREPWRSLGFDFDEFGGCRIGQVSLRIDSSHQAGFLGWAFDPSVDVIDGIESVGLEPASEVDSGIFASVDHVVVMTDSLERTSQAIVQHTGSELRRIREAGGGVRQAFHRSGEVVLEVVQTPSTSGTSLWGFVLVVPDLVTLTERLGPGVISQPREAKQPGRFIATIRREVGLGVNLALMTPDQRS